MVAGRRRRHVDQVHVAGLDLVRREPGVEQPFDAVRGAVAMSLRQKTYVTALRQYLLLLAGDANVVGVDLEAADTPLVQ